MLTGGRMRPRYILQLLFEENHKIANYSTATKAREKIDFESSRILEVICCILE
jgi:hypothetical protein